MHTHVLTLAVYVQYSLIYKVNRNSDLLMLTFPSTFWIFHQSFGGETDLRTRFSTLGSSCAFASCIAIFLTRGGWIFLKAGSYFGAETVPRDGHTNSHCATQQVPPWRASPTTCLSTAFSSLCFSPLSGWCRTRNSHDCSSHRQPWVCFWSVSSGTVELYRYRAQSKPNVHVHTQHHGQVDIVYSKLQVTRVWQFKVSVDLLGLGHLVWSQSVFQYKHLVSNLHFKIKITFKKFGSLMQLYAFLFCHHLFTKKRMITCRSRQAYLLGFFRKSKICFIWLSGQFPPFPCFMPHFDFFIPRLQILRIGKTITICIMHQGLMPTAVNGSTTDSCWFQWN